MKRTLICIMAGTLLPAAVSLADQQQPTPPAQQSQQQAQTQDQSAQSGMQQNQQHQQAPEGFVLLDERVVYLLANQPQQHFAAAVQKLQQKQTQGAAAELRIAANYIDMQASRATGQFQQDRQALDQASQRLNQLADQVQKGQINSADQLANTFAESNIALAKLFQGKSQNDLQSNKYDMAGHALQNAALSFRQALVWSKQQPPRQTMDVINNARQVARNMQSERMAMASRSESSSGSSQSSGAQASGSQSAQSEQSQSGNLSSQAQTASGNMNPITGTTPAEANNIAQHARDVSKALGQQIDQYASKLSSGSESAQQGANAQQQQEQSGAQSSQPNQGQRLSQERSSQQHPSQESTGSSSSNSQ